VSAKRPQLQADKLNPTGGGRRKKTLRDFAASGVVKVCVDNHFLSGHSKLQVNRIMSSRQTKLRPLFRWFAAMTLFLWMGAQALCQAHCLPGACNDESDTSVGDEATTSHSHHGDEQNPAHRDNSTDASCAALKSALSIHAPSPLIIPEFSVLYTLAPTALALDVTDIEPEALFSRHARMSDWVFTPLVCLGPAFRSQAPPVLL
jgi:hypothetical protein